MLFSRSMLTALPSGGSHFGQDWKRTGYCGLGAAVSKLGLQTKRPLDVDFVVCAISRPPICV